jgi:tetratricopeptide (TPR) repeat protein
MYEMFSGQLPFKGDYPQAIYYSIMNEDPEPLSRLRTGIPAELERIINKALAKKTTKRYQQIADLLTDLRKLTGDSKTKIAPLKTKTRPEFTIKVSPISMILGIILLAALIIAAWFFLFKGKSPAKIPITPVNEALTRPSLAVVYFENNSGNPNLDNWRSAFSELLATDLSQSKYIRVLRSDQIYSIFKKLNLLEAKKYSTEDLKEIAKKARVNRILKGSYIKAGDNFVITAMLINADTGETISSLSVRAKGEKNIFTKVDDLTKKIKLELNLTSDQIAADIDSNVGEITTASPESYMHYVQGITFFNELQYRKAIQSLEKAIEIDPGFAMAYRKISRAYGNLGYDVSEAGYLKRAFALRNRVSERERLLIQADFYRESEKTIEKAMESFEQLFQLYPGDLVGNSALALLYEDIEEWDKAIEQFKICINNDDSFIGPYEGMSRMYMNKGLANKAREVLENNINIVSNKAAVHRYLAWLYITLGEYDRALVEVGKSSSLDPSHYQNTRYLGDIYFCQGEPEKAAKEYRKLLQYKEGGAFYYYTVRMAALDAMQGKLISQKALIENLIKKAKEVKVRWADRTARYALADIYRISGNPGLALKEYDRIWQSAFEDGKVEDQRKSLWNKGLTYLEMGSIKKARETVDQLRSLIETGVNPKKIRYYHHLQAAIFLEEKEFFQAVASFNKALSRLPQYWELRIVFLYSLGNMFLQKGDIEKARETFETIVSSKGMTRIHNSVLISRSIYTLGKIYQEKGWKGKAIENYNKFIELWKTCDPQFQSLVEDARKRVNRLEKEN